MFLDLLKGARDWVSDKVSFVLGPWMRDPVKNMPLFHALVGYTLMLSMGWVSRGLLAKLVTWALLLVWTVVRSFKPADIVHPIDAAKMKLPELAHYHLGAAAGFLISSM